MAEEVGYEYGRGDRGDAERGDPPGSFRSARTPWPTPSPPTASPPTPRAARQGCSIVSEHCPFGDAAIEYPP